VFKLVLVTQRQLSAKRERLGLDREGDVRSRIDVYMSEESLETSDGPRMLGIVPCWTNRDYTCSSWMYKVRLFSFSLDENRDRSYGNIGTEKDSLLMDQSFVRLMYRSRFKIDGKSSQRKKKIALSHAV